MGQSPRQQEYIKKGKVFTAAYKRAQQKVGEENCLKNYTEPKELKELQSIKPDVDRVVKLTLDSNEMKSDFRFEGSLPPSKARGLVLEDVVFSFRPDSPGTYHKTQGLSTYENKYLAILLAIEQLRHYLQLAEFTIFTNQKSLIHLNEQRLITFWQHKAFNKLLGFHYKIVYKKGIDNGVANALFRRVHTKEAQVLSLSTVVPAQLELIQSSSENDSKAQELLTKLSLDPNVVHNFKLDNGITKYKNRIWLDSSVELQSKVLMAFHDAAIWGAFRGTCDLQKAEATVLLA